MNFLSAVSDFFDFLKKHKVWTTLFFFAICYLLFFIRLDIKLLFKDTIITGGDTASWYQSAQILREQFIPHGRLFGWSMANFFGYTELQHYFCVPFLIAVILSIFMPLTVALKITTILGALTLPVAFYFTVKKITKDYWISIASIFLSLIFVFNESYTMFGGNFLSTFAGEFCYSISMTVFVFFVGCCYESFMENKSPVVAGLLLGLCGLCHLFVFMVAFFVPFFFIFVPYIVNSVNASTKSKKKNKKNQTVEPILTFNTDGYLEKILIIYIIGFCLMAFWVVPMIFTRNLAQTISMIWRFSSFKEFFEKSFLALIIIGVVFNSVLMFTSKKHRVITFFIGYLYLVCLFFYIISTFLEIPDIRFIPPALVTSLLAIAVTLGYIPPAKKPTSQTQMLERLYFPMLAVACTIGVSIFVMFFPKTTTGWYNWNYTGYEAKKEWPNLEKIIQNYSGDDNSGRLLWEKQNQNDNSDFGSERAFENLHLFTGRPSTEGVHYGSSFMARATTYMQSEYSLHPVDPEAWRLYSNVNPDGWPTRFFITNSKDIILYSNEIKKKFEAHKDFTKTGEFGKFTIYTYKNAPNSYIRVTDNTNLCVINDNKFGDFKTDFYRAFRDYELFDKPFVPAKYAKGLEGYKKYVNYDLYREANFDNNYNFDNWFENYKYKNSITNENVDGFKIKFTTSEVGKPHIVGVSYCPNFKSKHGERIYPVSPGFMMIIPTSSDVEIYFGWNVYEIIGLILTFLLIPILIFYEHIASWRLPQPKLLARLAVSIFSVLVCLFLVVSLSSSRKIYSDLNVAHNLANRGENQKALDIANKYATAENLEKYDNACIYDYYFLKARLLKDRSPEDKKEALKIYQMLQTRYNHSRYNDSHKLTF